MSKLERIAKLNIISLPKSGQLSWFYYFRNLSAFDLSKMAQEASGHGLHDAATAFLEAATKKAKEEEKNKVDLVRSDFGRQHCQQHAYLVCHIDLVSSAEI